MKNKKGFLLGEYTLKVIIAVLSISLLLYLLFMLYGNFQDEKGQENANAILNELSEKMILAKDGSIQKMVLIDPGQNMISGSILVSFSKGEIRPEACEGNCLCVCVSGVAKEPYKLCNSEGECKNFEEDFDNVFIVVGGKKGLKDINIEFIEGKFVITENE